MRKRWTTSHQITPLASQLLKKMSCFSNHFPAMQSNGPQVVTYIGLQFHLLGIYLLLQDHMGRSIVEIGMELWVHLFLLPIVSALFSFSTFRFSLGIFMHLFLLVFGFCVAFVWKSTSSPIISGLGSEIRTREIETGSAAWKTAYTMLENRKHVNKIMGPTTRVIFQSSKVNICRLFSSH